MPGAGGKCLINCLHLCDGIIFNSWDIIKAKDNFDNHQITKDEYNKLLLNKILNTVPNINSNRWWCEYEIYNLIPSSSVDIPLHSYAEELKNLSGYLPTVGNYFEQIINFEKYLGRSTRIKFFPTMKFIDTAIRIKWESTPETPSPCLDLDRYHEWICQSNYIDYDIILDNYDPLNPVTFLEALHIVADYLKINLNLPLINQYLSKYREYHFSKIKELNITSYN